MRIAADATTLQLKERLQELLRVPVHCQRLAFDGAAMPDALALSAAGVTDGSGVALVLLPHAPAA